MILGRFLFWFIIIYVLYKFIVGFVMPVAGASKKMKDAMKNMQDNMNQPNAEQATTPNNRNTEKPSTVSKGDYIDFEEVKE